MIRVEFQEPTTPEWIAWKQEAVAERDKVIQKVAAGEEFEIKETLYKKMKDVIFGAYNGKCAYCEARIDFTVKGKGDVEHFRPKKGVIDEKTGKPVMITMPDGTLAEHPGYYWLAYDWRNLLPACNQCNSLTKNKVGPSTGKGNRFPIVGLRATKPGEEDLEQALLLHPSFDNPETHFKFDESSGILLSITDVGKECIDILGLNREGLPETRRKEYLGVLAMCNAVGGCLNDPPQMKTYLELLADYNKGKNPFCFAARNALQKLRDQLKGIFDFLFP